MTYCLWMEQVGGGCDYTIGCGLKMYPLEASTIEEAREEVAALFSYEGEESYGYGETELSDAMIIRIEEDAMPILEQQIHRTNEKIEENKRKEREAMEKVRDEVLKQRKEFDGHV